MNKENVLFSIVGVLIGFIVGFVFANTANRSGLAYWAACLAGNVALAAGQPAKRDDGGGKSERDDEAAPAFALQPSQTGTHRGAKRQRRSGRQAGGNRG